MTNLKGEFVVRIGNELHAYTNTDDIPLEFDNLIKFNPIPPEPPHTPEEHEDISGYLEVFKEIMKREKKRNITNI